MENFNRAEQREANSFTTGLNNDIKNSDSRAFFSNDQQNNRQATDNLVQSGTIPGLDLFGSQNSTNTQGDKTAGGTTDGAPRNNEVKPPSPNGDATAGGKNAESTTAPAEPNAPKHNSGVIPVGPEGDGRQNTAPERTGTANDNQTVSQDSALKTPESDLDSVPGDRAAQPPRGQDGHAGQNSNSATPGTDG